MQTKLKSFCKNEITQFDNKIHKLEKEIKIYQDISFCLVDKISLLKSHIEYYESKKLLSI
tara:strand:+ start:124 stop:303 length:180 start_codon:yes stop_codon:yes gene_type:complete